MSCLVLVSGRLRKAAYSPGARWDLSAPDRAGGGTLFGVGSGAVFDVA
jgi:hypothetical protein